MYRFLLSPRWVAFALAVTALAVVCIRLGLWQLERHDERAQENETVRTNLAAEPVPLTDVATVDGDAPAGEEWQRVVVSGTYDAQHQVLVRYQVRDDGPGVDVVTPLVTDSGAAVLIDRGWLATPDRAEDLPAPPAVTPGEVTVTGWLRVNSTAGDEATVPVDGAVRAVSSDGFSESVPYQLYGGYVDLLEQQPEPVTALVAPEEPDVGQGPHFFYGLQWLFFALLALSGLFYFAYAEAHPKRTDRTVPDRSGGARHEPVPR